MLKFEKLYAKFSFKKLKNDYYNKYLSKYFINRLKTIEFIKEFTKYSLIWYKIEVISIY